VEVVLALVRRELTLPHAAEQQRCDRHAPNTRCIGSLGVRVFRARITPKFDDLNAPSGSAAEG